LSRCDNSARFGAGGTNGRAYASEGPLRRWTRRYSSQRDEFHDQGEAATMLSDSTIQRFTDPALARTS
jgi:hypothetical protein